MLLVIESPAILVAGTKVAPSVGAREPRSFTLYAEKNESRWRRSPSFRTYIEDMGDAKSEDPGEIARLLQRAAAGDQAAMGFLFSAYRDRLKRMVHLRLRACEKIPGYLKNIDIS
jgi:hypothetical protein